MAIREDDLLPEMILIENRASEGDDLSLSPIAWGLLTTAYRRGVVSAHVERQGQSEPDEVGKLHLLDGLCASGLARRQCERRGPDPATGDLFIDFSLTERGRTYVKGA